ncbi:MAG: hypothetical protein LBC37_05110 [Zoogloeaceae bacterium]|jgi:hypothetical protein|nr:hypothetical protein [Zoogloeaceae bacterium]
MNSHDHTAYIHALLARFHAGKALPEPPAFTKALRQLAFDYTPEAIVRVDRLLAQLRSELNKPKPDDFLAVPRNRAFLFLLAFMVCEAAARYRSAPARWTDYAGFQVLRAEQDIALNFPESFSTALVCEIEGEGLLFPLSYLCAALFNDQPGSVMAGTDAIMRRAIGVPVLSDPGQEVAVPEENDPAWRLGLALGDSVRLCIQVHLAAGSVSFAPQLLQQQADGRMLITSLMYDADDGIKSAHYRMNNPEEGIVAQALAYDGFIGLPRFRSDALILDGICHLGATPLRASLALPYWPAADDHQLVLHDFRLLEFSGDEPARERLRTGLFSRVNATSKLNLAHGEQTEEIVDGLWQTHYVHEDDKLHLAARRAALPPLPWEGATPETEAAHAKVFSLDDFDAAAWRRELPDAEAEVHHLRKAESLGLTKDPLNASIHDFPTLLREGRVVWGALIQANNNLFASGTDDLPAEVVYSIDGSVPPDVLAPVAQALFALRKQLPPQADDALKKCADYLNAETVRAFGWPVPASLVPAPGLPERLPDGLRISTLWVMRKYLPHGYLAGNVLPLLASDACPGHVMVIPANAWPATFRASWDRAFEGTLRERWPMLWRTLAAGERRDDAALFARATELLADYADHGEPPSDTKVQPPLMEWEYGRCDWLSTYAELLLRKAETLRAQGRHLPHGLIRQAFSARVTAMMVRMHSMMLEQLRGKSGMRLTIHPDEIQYVALGLLTGADTHALTLARLLLALWRDPDHYGCVLRPEVWFLFRLLARHLNLELPEREPFARRPRLEALLENDAWKSESAPRIKPMLETACDEHTLYAPQGPFLGLPIALAVILRLRKLAGRPNPRVEHDLLRVPLGAPPPGSSIPTDLRVALNMLGNPLTQRVRQRMRRMGFDESIIAEAVLNDQPPKTNFELAQSIMPHDEDEQRDSGNSGNSSNEKWRKQPE